MVAHCMRCDQPPVAKTKEFTIAVYLWEDNTKVLNILQFTEHFTILHAAEMPGVQASWFSVPAS